MSDILIADKKHGLASGLEWVVIDTFTDPKHKASKKLDSYFKNKEEATHYADYVSGRARYAGLYSPSLIQKNTAKRLHATALVFREYLKSYFGSEAADLAYVNAILTIKLSENIVSLIVIEGGEVVWDEVNEVSQIAERLRGYEKQAEQTKLPYTYFGNYNEFIFASENQPLDGATLLATVKSNSLLKKKPTNWLMVALFTFVIMVLAASVSYYYFVYAPELEKKERQRKEALINKTQEYLKGVAELFKRAGYSAESMIPGMKPQLLHPYYYQGWQLKAIKCNSQDASCDYEYQRVAGLSKELKNNQPTEILRNDVVEVANVKTSKPNDMPLKQINMAELDDKSKILEKYVFVTQYLLNAKIAPKLDSVKVLAIKGVDTSKVKREFLIYEIPFSVAYPIAYHDEIIKLLPSGITIKKYNINSNSNNSLDKALMVELIGTHYVK